MLKTLITVVIGLLAFSANAQNGFLIKGKISGNNEGKIVKLTYENLLTSEKINDSTLVKNGSFILKGKVADVVRARLVMYAPGAEIDRTQWERFEEMDQQEFMLENKNFTVTGEDIKHGQIIGGEAQADFLVLRKQLKPIEDKLRPFTQKMIQYMKEKNEKAMDELSQKFKPVARERQKVNDDYFRKYPDSYTSLYMVADGAAVIDPPKFEPLFNSLSPRMRNSVLGRKLADELQKAKQHDVGKPAIYFTQNDIEGKPVALSSFKGKYVLLDFWASWCGPCRAESPYLVKAYEKFKDKNFEIISVSLDDKKEKWLQAITADGLSWIQLSDLKGLKNAVALKYNVRAIPQNFLISPDGIILARNLRGEELEKKLAEIFGSGASK